MIDCVEKLRAEWTVSSSQTPSTAGQGSVVVEVTIESLLTKCAATDYEIGRRISCLPGVEIAQCVYALGATDE